MPKLLAQTLIDQHIASTQEVEEALKRQVVHGGSLDTNLLEAGVVSESELLRALGDTYGLPTASRDDIDGIAAHIPRLFPLMFAETYHLVPYRLIGQNLGVLANKPGDGTLFRRIEERLQLAVKPTLTAEVRLHYAMFRLYGSGLLPRFRDLLVKLDGEDVLGKAGDTDPPTSQMLTWGLPVGWIARPASPHRRRQPIKVGGLLGRLATASDRDTIVNILLEVVLTTFEFAALFLVQSQHINGWRGMDPESTRRVASISLPIELPSVFQTIYATHGHYLGPLPNNSVNLKLIEDLDRRPPRAAFLAPLLVGGKLAAILYADNGSRGVPSKRVASILLLTHRAGMCLESLIRQQKKSASEMLETRTPASGPTLIDDGDYEPIVETPAVDTDLPVSAEAVAAAEREVAHVERIETEDAAETLAEEIVRPVAAPVAAPSTLDPAISQDGEIGMMVSSESEVAQEPGIDVVAASEPEPETSEGLDESMAQDSETPEPATQPAQLRALQADMPMAAIETEAAVPPLGPGAGGGALWESVKLEDLDTSTVTGEFSEDASPDAATAAFARGLATSAPPEGHPLLEMEKPTVEESYVAFAEVDAKSPEESVGEWEDVFVETMGTERADLGTAQKAKTREEAPPAVTWQDVIAEAEAAPTLTTTPTSGNLEIAGTIVDEREMLLDSLEADDPEIWRTAINKLTPMGTTLDSELQKRFPGHIRVDPFAPGTKLPSFSQCSGLTALLAARGAGAAAVVIPCLESNDRIERFFSVYYLYAVHYPAALELLARRLYDAEPRNRFLAADALRTYRHEPGYRRIIQGLRDHLKVPVFEAQVATVQVLGQLRDPSAVPSLIPLVVSPRQALARASASALTVICGQAFGSEVARWAEWWQAHYNKPREAWLVEGMRHPDANVRRIAAREFQLLTGHTTPSESGATPEQRENQAPA